MFVHGAGAQSQQRSHTASACVFRVQDAEVDVLGRVAAALNVPPTVVELKIFEWQVRRAAYSSLSVLTWTTGMVLNGRLQICDTVPNPLPQTKLLDADAAPKVDIAGKSPAKAIMQRAGLRPPTTEDLYQGQRAREVGTSPWHA